MFQCDRSYAAVNPESNRTDVHVYINSSFQFNFLGDGRILFLLSI